MSPTRVSARHALAVLFSAVVVASLGPGAVVGLAGPSTASGASGPDVPGGTATPSGSGDGAVADGVQSQTEFVNEMQAIVSDHSRSDRDVALAAGDRALVSRQRMATDQRQVAALGTERTNLRGARALLNEIDSADGARTGDLGATASLVTVGLTVQAAQVESGERPVDPADVRLPETDTPSHTTPSAAAFALLDRYDVTPTAEQAADIRALDHLPGQTRSELTEFLDAYLAYYDATQSAYADVNREQLAAVVNGEAADGVDRQAIGVDVTKVRAAQLELLRASDDLRSSLDALNRGSASTETGTVGAAQALTASSVVVPGVVSVDLAGADNHYKENYKLQVDVGGNDIYHNNAGGAEGTGVHPDTDTRADAAALVDLGGNDKYKGRNGGGNALAAGFLVDSAGDDTYAAKVDSADPRGHGTNGGANVAAIGFLVDGGGEDTYRAGTQGTNGGGHNVASGFLLDAGLGNDSYAGGSEGTNGGGVTLGYGLLLDTAGQETYDAENRGTNGGARNGGIGFLLDGGDGDDTYNAGARGTNGGSGFDGIAAFILDAGGSDTYDAGDRATNGGATTNGVGFVVDIGAGADTFDAGSVGTNGGGGFSEGGHLLNVGPGDDTYEAGDRATNGGAFVIGAGFLLDTAGDDVYEAGETATNGGAALLNFSFNTPPVPIPSKGTLLDTAGSDRYADATVECQDCSRIPKGTVGAQIDSEDPVGQA